jgi:uncharacterized membrane protein YebE (DUF533 family)
MTKVEELRDKIYTKAAGNINGLRSEFSCSPSDDRAYDAEERELATDLYALIAAAHAEGAEEERERILASGRRIDRDECTDGFAECDEFVCPYSLIAPKEKP